MTDTEKISYGDELARATQALGELETQKKEVAAAIKSQIETKTAEINVKSRILANGYEYREIECRVDFNHPGKGVKSITRLDTFELVREEKMQPHETQAHLFKDKE